jgi:hypothetical protein
MKKAGNIGHLTTTKIATMPQEGQRRCGMPNRLVATVSGVDLEQLLRASS